MKTNPEHLNQKKRQNTCIMNEVGLDWAGFDADIWITATAYVWSPSSATSTPAKRLRYATVRTPWSIHRQTRLQSPSTKDLCPRSRKTCPVSREVMMESQKTQSWEPHLRHSCLCSRSFETSLINTTIEESV